jgi:hypothetical protein
VIVNGDKAAVDRLAARYNLVVKRHMRSGGVLGSTRDNRPHCRRTTS